MYWLLLHCCDRVKPLKGGRVTQAYCCRRIRVHISGSCGTGGNGWKSWEPQSKKLTAGRREDTQSGGNLKLSKLTSSEWHTSYNKLHFLNLPDSWAIFCLIALVFWDSVLLFSSNWPGTHYVNQVLLELSQEPHASCLLGARIKDVYHHIWPSWFFRSLQMTLPLYDRIGKGGIGFGGTPPVPSLPHAYWVCHEFIVKYIRFLLLYVGKLQV